MNASDDPRTRTVRWEDPSRFERPLATTTGLEFMRALLEGALPPPPFMQLLGVRLVSVEPSEVAFEFEPAEFAYSPLGTVHGGVVTVLLDSAMGCSVHTALERGVGYTTVELKVNFLRPVTTASGVLRAEGRVVHAGARVAIAEAGLFDRERKRYAHATSTMMILRPAPEPGTPTKGS